AYAMSPSGQVVGESWIAGNAGSHAFSWTRRGGMIDIGTLGGTYSVAYAVSSSGQVVGISYLAGDACCGVLSWTPTGGMIDVGGLGGSGSNVDIVDFVNPRGQVVGGSETAGGQFHGFSWTPTGGMIDLGTLGGSGSNALAVSPSGLVVGQSLTAGDANV